MISDDGIQKQLKTLGSQIWQWRLHPSVNGTASQIACVGLYPQFLLSLNAALNYTFKRSEVPPMLCHMSHPHLLLLQCHRPLHKSIRI